MSIQLGGVIGTERVRAPQGLEVGAAESIVEPESAEEISEIVRKCESDKIALAPSGAARTLSQIRRAPVPIGISLRRMAKIIAYEPDDMTVIAQCGITVADLNATLAAHGQRLPVDPRDPGATTIGALIGAAHAGPLRLSEGTVRDLMIGVQFVGHDGHLIRAGGRVVKNVAGYDLMKVMIGSFGTLAVGTEAIFKVRPIPENYSLALARFADAAAAFKAASALHDQLALIHLEVLSAGAGDVFGGGGQLLVMAGFAGIRSELDYQRDRIARVLGPSTETFEEERASELYRTLRDCDFGDDALAARMAVLPAELARCASESGAEFVAHAGSGCMELWMSGGDVEASARWRAIAHSGGGHLRISSAPAAIRPSLDFFDQPNAGAFKLMQRLKTSFDPVGVFNPGCFVGAL